MGIELTGMDELRKTMVKISGNVKEKEHAAIKAGAEVIRKEITQRVPTKTGNLKKSISVSKIKKDSAGLDYVDVGPSKHDGFYGVMLEFGTAQRKHKKGKGAKSTGYVAAQPFVEPAFLSSKKEAMDAIARVMREAISDV